MGGKIVVSDVELQQRRAIKRASTDFSFWFHLIQIYDKDARKMAHVKLRDEQVTLSEALFTENRLLVCKPRQIGATTVTLAYFAMQAYFAREPDTYIISSLKDTSVKSLIRTVASMYASLPLFMRRTLSISNDHEIEFGDTGAKIVGYAAGGRGGARSITAVAILMTEFAFYPNQEEFLIANDAVVGDFGKIVIETTADRPGDTYHELVMQAARGKGVYKLLFFPWTAHTRYRVTPPKDFVLSDEELKYGLTPEQAAWRRNKIGALHNRVEQFQREYPLTPEEAFINDSTTWFPHLTIKSLIGIDPIVADTWNVYHPTRAEVTYGIVSDTALGTGGDYSTAFIVDEGGELCAAYITNKRRPKDFAYILRKASEAWGNALVLVESNSYGQIVIDDLEELHVPLWSGDDRDKWHTNEQSKLYAYQELETAWAGGLLKTLPRSIITQLAALQVDPKKKTPEAPQGMHDDEALTLALAAVMVKTLRKRAASRNNAGGKGVSIETLLARMGIKFKRGQEAIWKR